MKSLVMVLLLPSLLLIGCGKMTSSQGTAGAALEEMNTNGSLNNGELDGIDESLLNETLEMSETGSNSLMMKLGGAELLIDFVAGLSDKPEAPAMVINGVQVATEIANDPQKLQSLIASLVTSQLSGVNIQGIPAGQLVQVGLDIIKGDKPSFDFSRLFGTLVRGALNMFLAQVPFGQLIGAIAAPIVDNVVGKIEGNQSNGNQSSQPSQPANNQNGNQNNNNQNNNNSSGSLVGSVVDTIGGAISTKNPRLGGIISLISNLFK